MIWAQGQVKSQDGVLGRVFDPAQKAAAYKRNNVMNWQECFPNCHRTATTINSKAVKASLADLIRFYCNYVKSWQFMEAWSETNTSTFITSSW